MARYSLVVCLLMVALAAPLIPPCHGQNFGDLVTAILSEQFKGLWRSGSIELLDHYCNYRVKPDLEGLKLKFVGSLTCDGWTNIRGTARTSSQSNVVNQAVQDFLTKAQAAGLITSEQAASVIHV